MSQRLAILDDVPRMSAGAPEPIVVATEDRVLVTYRSTTRDDAAFHAIEFTDPLVHKFGAPNDEALQGHPLYAIGLRSYVFAEVHDSDWIRELTISNRVHPRHHDGLFRDFRHFVGTFHDSTIEIVARGYRLLLMESFAEAVESIPGPRRRTPVP